VILSNPWGFLALLGIPAVVAIHLLRVRARRVLASTLFLLDSAPVPSRGGRRLERLRATPLFWVQILSVLVLTWLLVEPRWLREDSSRRVVLVVDGSASMTAFESELEEALARNLPALERASAVTEWVVLPSDARERRLYAGRSREEAVAAALSWKPHLGAQDPAPVLATARSVAGAAGVVLLVTDHVVDVPAGVELLSVGAPRDNVGFAGVEVSDDGFRALVKNSGTKRETREVSLENGAPVKSLELGPSELGFLEGKFPDGASGVTLVLSGGDAFPLDDRLPIAKPALKTIRVFVAPELAANAFVGRFVETLAPFERVDAAAACDLAITRAPESAVPAIVLPAGKGEPPLAGPIVSESDLDLQGLVARPLAAPSVVDDVLVWQGNRPLLFVSGDDLTAGFSLEESNAERIPGFVLLLHRFAESVRERTAGAERVNAELNQLVTATYRAPSEPGFFEATPLLTGAARFADVREADLRTAAARDLDGASEREARVRNTLPDPLENVWVLALLGLALGAFALSERDS
jgi:hypothetical protein